MLLLSVWFVLILYCMLFVAYMTIIFVRIECCLPKFQLSSLIQFVTLWDWCTKLFFTNGFDWYQAGSDCLPENITYRGLDKLLASVWMIHYDYRVPTVRESRGILRESGKTERVREKSGNFKIPLTRPIIYALFSQFLSSSLRPCKHCRLVYIAIFYNGTKFSITFVYLVLFYWCRE